MLCRPPFVVKIRCKTYKDCIHRSLKVYHLYWLHRNYSDEPRWSVSTSVVKTKGSIDLGVWIIKKSHIVPQAAFSEAWYIQKSLNHKHYAQKLMQW